MWLSAKSPVPPEPHQKIASSPASAFPALPCLFLSDIIEEDYNNNNYSLAHYAKKISYIRRENIVMFGDLERDFRVTSASADYVQATAP